MSRPSKNIKKRLQLGKLKLETLLEVTIGINNNIPKEDLLTLYKHVLIDELKIGKLLLFSFDNGDWGQELCFGVDSHSIDVPEDLLKFQDIKVLSNSENENLSIFDVIVPISHKSKPLAYLLIGDFDGEKIEVSPIIKHLTFIQTLTNIIIVAIENKRLHKENIDQAAIKKEMELASKMQALLFPKDLQNNEEIEIATYYNPHRLVGGDYYDFIELNSDEIAFCIADVSGKGVPAALLMSNFQASLRALIKRTSSLSELVIELNRNIISNANREKFITAFIGKYHKPTRNLQFINAGHNPPALLENYQFTPLSDGCTVLGVFENLPSVTEKNITLSPNALMACYTDGVVEQTNIKDVEFGIENLELLLKENWDKPIDQVVQSITEKIEDFKKDVDYKDDIALLCLRFC